MPRQPRLNIENGVYHVTQRGLERRDIVADNQDRQEWFRLLSRQATRCDWRVFAYALLNNHFHLFLRTPQPNLSQGMQAFEAGYVSLHNRRHGRVGPLFQSRFHAVLVEFESHARELSRYVHLNPHRAGLDQQPGQYAWCSYRYYLDPRGAPNWLDWRTIFAEISQREAAARIGYRRFVEAGMSSPLANPLNNINDGGMLGSLEFSERFSDRGQAPQNSKMAEQSLICPQRSIPPILNFAVPDPSAGDRFEQLLAAVAAEFAVPIAQIQAKGRHGNWPRDAAIWLCHEVWQDSHEEVAKRFGGVTPSAIRESLRRTSERMRSRDTAAFRDVVNRLMVLTDH